MPSYLQYKRFLSVLDEDKIISWFTTENGIHIPLREGQTKEEATKNFFANKKTEVKPVTVENRWTESERHFNNMARGKKVLQTAYSDLLRNLPQKFKNGEQWKLDVETMESPDDFEKFSNKIKEMWESGAFEKSEYSDNNLKKYFNDLPNTLADVRGSAKTYGELEARFEPKRGINIDSEGNKIKPEILEKIKGTKAVDANGNPVALYIGTREKVVGNKFDFNHKRENSVSKQRAIFMTTKKEVAETYKEGEGEVKKVFVKMERPLIVDFDGATFHNGGYEEFVVHPYGDPSNKSIIKRNSRWADANEAPVINKIVRYAKQNGYDGVIATNITDNGPNEDFYKTDPYNLVWFHNDDYIVFDPKQIVVDDD